MRGLISRLEKITQRRSENIGFRQEEDLVASYRRLYKRPKCGWGRQCIQNSNDKLGGQVFETAGKRDWLATEQADRWRKATAMRKKVE